MTKLKVLRFNGELYISVSSLDRWLGESALRALGRNPNILARMACDSINAVRIRIVELVSDNQEG